MKVLRHPGRLLGSAHVSHTVKRPLSPLDGPVLLLDCLGLDLTSRVPHPATQMVGGDSCRRVTITNMTYFSYFSKPFF